MSDSRFWRTIAVVFVAGVFYLANSMDNSASQPFAELTQEVHAGDVAIASNNSYVRIVTSSDDGRTINVWAIRLNNSAVSFVGSFRADEAKPKSN